MCFYFYITLNWYIIDVLRTYSYVCTYTFCCVYLIKINQKINQSVCPTYYMACQHKAIGTITTIITIIIIITGADLKWNISTAKQSNKGIPSEFKNSDSMFVRSSGDVVQAPSRLQLCLHTVVSQQLNQSIHRTFHTCVVNNTSVVTYSIRMTQMQSQVKINTLHCYYVGSIGYRSIANVLVLSWLGSCSSHLPA